MVGSNDVALSCTAPARRPTASIMRVRSAAPRIDKSGSCGWAWQCAGRIPTESFPGDPQRCGDRGPVAAQLCAPATCWWLMPPDDAPAGTPRSRGRTARSDTSAFANGIPASRNFGSARLPGVALATLRTQSEQKCRCKMAARTAQSVKRFRNRPRWYFRSEGARKTKLRLRVA